jgi:hypothetical protein
MKWNKNLTLQAVIALFLFCVLLIRPMQLDHPDAVARQLFPFLFMAFISDLLSQRVQSSAASKICKGISVLVGVILFGFVLYCVAGFGLLAAWSSAWTPHR